MATRVTEHEARIKDLIACLRSSKRKITQAKDELGVERNRHISIEDSFATTLEEEVHKKVAKVVELAKIQDKEERERDVEMSMTKYLASDAF